MRKIGYLALSLYLLLVSLSAVIASLMIPNIIMAALAFIASLGIFLDVCVPARKSEKQSPFAVPKNINSA